MAISRSDMERQLRNMGGIMSVQDPRQGYFLGKLVRKAKRAVKKVVKSPIGKAAILGGLTFGIPGTQFSGLAGGKGLGSFFGKGSFNPLKALITKGPQTGTFGTSGLGRLLGKFGLAEGTKLTGLGKIAGIGGLSGLAGLMAAGEQDEDETDLSKLDRGEGLDIDRIVRLARQNDPEFRFLPGAEFTDMYAEGGEVKELTGDDRLALEMFGKLFKELSNKEKDFIYYKQNMAYGGRIGKQEGGEVDKTTAMIMDLLKRGMDNDSISSITGVSPEQILKLLNSVKKDKPQEKAEGGIMDLGGNEMDLRGGGFVPIGAKEKADDVPARLSKNEFVMTADAVRAAGGGSVDKGADKMYKMMKNLEAQV